MSDQFSMMTNMINSMMGQEVLSSEHLGKIMEGTKKQYDKGGMGAVVDYLLKVTQVEDVNREELLNFANSIKDDPAKGFDILKNAAEKKDKK